MFSEPILLLFSSNANTYLAAKIISVMNKKAKIIF